MTQRWSSAFPLSSASDKKSFAYESTVKRWPTILTQVIDEINKKNGGFVDECKQATDQNQKISLQNQIEQGKQLIADIAGLIYEIRHDRELYPFKSGQYPEDHEAYNSELALLAAKNQHNWFTVPWLYGECWLYRCLRHIISNQSLWSTFDPFLAQKVNTFKSSRAGILALAKSFLQMQKNRPQEWDEKEMSVEWKKMAEICLWGNATDLSLLTTLTHEEIQALQSAERGADFVLKDDIPMAWQSITASRLKNLGNPEGDGGRVDIVMDNSGFELYTDLILADWFLNAGLGIGKVVFHPKLMGWFVSDVNPHDFIHLLSSLGDTEFFPAPENISTEELDADHLVLKELAERWSNYVKEGKFSLSTNTEYQLGDSEGGSLAEFWTTPYPFSDLPEKDPTLLKELQKSDLVIFKGDLNYRKLTGDSWWPTTTPFSETLGPLKGKFNILSLRTCKADVCVGLGEGVEETVEKTDPSWRINGKYAVISFEPKE